MVYKFALISSVIIYSATGLAQSPQAQVLAPAPAAALGAAASTKLPSVDMSHCQPEPPLSEKSLVDGKKFLTFANDNNSINYVMDDHGQLVISNPQLQEQTDSSGTFVRDGNLMLKTFHTDGLPTMFQSTTGANTYGLRDQEFVRNEYSFAYLQRDGVLSCYVDHIESYRETTEPLSDTDSKDKIITRHMDAPVNLAKKCEHQGKRGTPKWWQCMDSSTSDKVGTYFVKDIYGNYPDPTILINTTESTDQSTAQPATAQQSTAPQTKEF